jgi:hypothetical protein
MLLTGEKDDQRLEFFKDSYLTHPLDLVMPLACTDIIQLDIEVQSNSFHFFKLAFLDEL